MATLAQFRPAVQAARERLREGRERLKLRHQGGSPGIQVCTALAALLDEVVLSIYRAAIDELPVAAGTAPDAGIAIVAHGGYGRRDVAPYSDVDLMILHEGGSERQIVPLAKRLLQDLFDVGLTVGQSVRTPREACRWALKDATVFTSLAESRFLVGEQALFDKYLRSFRKASMRHWRRMIGAIEKARLEERAQFGGTVYLLEPNVKRSPGGLRDLQLLRWVGFARYGQSEPEALRLMGVLPREDHRAIRRATEFLLHLRNEMHFHAGKAHDSLERAEQVRIAEVLRFEGTESLLPVERFMSEYFRHTNAVRHIVGRFLDGSRPWTRLADALGPLFSHQVERDFRVGPRRIWATKRGLEKIRQDLAQILRLTDLANLYNKEIAHNTWKAIRESARRLPNELSAAAAERFLSLLSQPAQLGKLLHNLHELGVLEKILPDFTHARCLLQFNEYHKYTVDEHCIRAVERATEFLARPGALGEVYRGIKEKRTLHLALLIHDLGKGYVEDHSEVGARIAGETAYRLRLPDREAETLRFLVHKHLMMSHLAFRRDTSDEGVLLKFAVDVGSPEALRMLFVLTCADLGAVGPGVLNDWKLEVLCDLYQRTMEHLSGDSPSAATERRRGALRSLLQHETAYERIADQIRTLPSSYLHSAPPERIAEDLRQLAALTDREVKIWCRYVPETGTMEYTVGTQESITPGVFHKLTGGFSSQGLQILSADINTLAGGLVLDRFIVLDRDFAEEPPPSRIAEIEARLSAALTSDTPPAFRRVWQRTTRSATAAVPALPTQVKIDSSTSEHFTIIDVFALDRMGLLYTITRTLFELGLSVSLAKISTYLDQVVDVFYITDQQGRKIHDEHWLGQIREKLLQAIEAHEREAACT
jgi:[protein-PII] uridylyltransferase